MIATRQWPADPLSVREARRFTADALGHLHEDRRSVVELLVSELVTNSVVHARSPVTLRLEASGHEVRVEVTDQQPGTVRAMRAGPEDLHGRGLHIVQALADRWGVQPADPGGKTVWFAINLASTAGGRRPRD